MATASPESGAAPGAWTDDLGALILAGRFAEADSLIRRQGEGNPAPMRLELALRQRWGFTLLEQGDHAAAEVQLQAAAHLAPEDADAQADLAFARLRAGRNAEAVAPLRRALELNPDHTGALVNLGTALMALKQFEAAEAIYRRLLAQDPSHAAALRNLGVLLNALERYDEALAFANASLALAPSATGFATRATALHELGRYEDCLEACARAMEAGADAYELHTRRGMALNGLGRVEEAMAAFDAAVTLRPDRHLAYYRRASVRLLAGDFQGGWPDYEARWRDEAFLRNAAGPAARALHGRFRLDVDADDLAGRRVLVVGEQGIGDEIMFASVLPDLARTAAAVTCICDPRLVRLFTASMPQVTFVAAADAVRSPDNAHDIVLPAGSLGRIFRHQVGLFPGAPYLQPSPEAMELWRTRLGPTDAATRIGLSWRGGMPSTRRGQRSIPLTDLTAALRAPDRTFVSLQYGDPREDVAAARAALGVGVRLFPPDEITDFEDLAALVANLDAVVTVQTALVHLAGATGARCLTLVPRVAEWRYMASGPTMPWYGSVQLFRQRERGDWLPVVAAAEAGLAEWLRGRKR